MTSPFAAIALILLFSQLGYASNSCTAIDNEISEMGALRNQRVLDQEKDLDINIAGQTVRNGVGWCFAYATADLVSHKLKKKVSASDIAITYDLKAHFLKKGPYNPYLDITEGGFADEAIQVSNQEGFCPEEVIKSDNFDSFGKDESMFQTFRLTSQVHLSPHQNSCDRRTTAAGKMLKALSVEQIAAITEKYANDSKTKWKTLLNEACKGKRISLPKETQIRDLMKPNASQDQMLDAIDLQLASGNIALMSYDYGKLPMRNPFYNLVPLPFRMSAYHASTIIGREIDPKTGECLYKLRNTWGARCFNITASPAAGCKDGYLYVSRQSLRDVIDRATWLE